jgi:predicted Rossmann fold flavoprotein
MKKFQVIVIGGGAAGFFGAIACAQALPEAEVTILEKSREVLQKVLISGGGRCNVTHACFDPADLVKYYPRGERELLGAFNRFGTRDTIDWFEKRGVKLKTEKDGRMFPVTDKSSTIIQCLCDSASRAGVTVKTQMDVTSIQPPDETHPKWKITCRSEEIFLADALLVTAGSSHRIWDLLKNIGHQIVPPVPSLFTFNCKDPRLEDLAGISLPAVGISITGTKFKSHGPFLITHWGMSGPAILRLSAFAARLLSEQQYRFEVDINLVFPRTNTEIQTLLESYKATIPKKIISANGLFDIPLRFWQRLVLAAGINAEQRWTDISKQQTRSLCEQLTAARFQINGKSTFKEEFVTAGGVLLKEVDFRHFKSKIHPRLFFAGEVLDIDAVTGGFNFQAAWTGGDIAGKGIAECLGSEV